MREREGGVKWAVRMTMRAFAGLALAALCGCGPSALPADKALYAGDWKAEGASLRITARGDVKYRARGPSGEIRLEGRIKSFGPKGFVAGPPSASAWFASPAPPQRVGGRWRVVMDGREFWRDPGPPGVKERAPRG